MPTTDKNTSTSKIPNTWMWLCWSSASRFSCNFSTHSSRHLASGSNKNCTCSWSSVKIITKTSTMMTSSLSRHSSNTSTSSLHTWIQLTSAPMATSRCSTPCKLSKESSSSWNGTWGERLSSRVIFLSDYSAFSMITSWGPILYPRSWLR